MTHEGIARCKLVNDTDGATMPDMIGVCTWQMKPTESSALECLIAFSTEGDRLAELEAHEGILDIFEYGEI